MICDGRIRLVSPGLQAAIRAKRGNDFQRITVESRGTFLIDLELASLHAATAGALGSANYRLAGRSFSL